MTQDSLLLGLDIGTTHTKAVLLDEQGVVRVASRNAVLSSPRPGWAEEDTDQWWRNVCSICRELSAEHRIEAIAVTGMVPTVVALDRSGAVVRPSIQQNDARAVRQIAFGQGRLDSEDVLSRTGSAITQQSIGPKLLWMAENEPESFSRIDTVMGSYDWIGFQLTGARSVEANWALESGLYDLHRNDWADDICEVFGARRDWLPPVLRSGMKLGAVNSAAAAATGLVEGTPVYVGGADHILSAFASGLAAPGDMLVKLGGATDILIVAETPRPDWRLFLDHHARPGEYLVNGCMAASGSLINWFARELGGNRSLVELDVLAEAAGPGSGGAVLLPYFLGEKTPIQDPDARGLWGGLHLGLGAGHMFRSILEGIAFGVRHHVDVFNELDLPIGRVKVTDGGARSALYCQIIADVLQRPLERIEIRESSAVGAAFIAGIGAGRHADWADIDRYGHTDRVFEPRPETAAVYDAAYQTYRSLYPSRMALPHS